MLAEDKGNDEIIEMQNIHDGKAIGTSYGSTLENDIEDGNTPDDLENFAYNEKSIRRAFQRKVFSLLMIQLFLTTSIIGVFVLNKNVQNFVSTHPEFIGFSLIFMAITIIVLLCCGKIRRKHPINLIFLTIFTLSQSFLLGVISANYDTIVVMMVIGVTALICIALTLYALQTKCDFTTIGGLLLACLLVFIVFGIITIFIPSRIMEIIYAASGTLLFSFYLIFDVQLIAGGGHRYSIDPEEYIFAVLTIYLDIINLYMYILSLVGLVKN